MQLHMVKIQSEGLVQVLSLHYNVGCCWVNWLNVIINRVPKYDDMSENSKFRNLYRNNYILLMPEMLYSNLLIVNWLIVKF